MRIHYIQKIRYYRSQNRPFIYLDETYLHSGHTCSKSWSDESSNGLFSNISKGNRLIIIHAGGEMGFIPNCLLMFKSGTKTGDYHHKMNSENYGKNFYQICLLILFSLSIKHHITVFNSTQHPHQIPRRQI